MTFAREWLLNRDWELAVGLVAAGVLLLSQMAVLISRGLRRSPAIRDSVLLSALVACLALPGIAAFISLTGATLVSWPVVAEESADAVTRAVGSGPGNPAAELPARDASQISIPLARDRAEGAGGFVYDASHAAPVRDDGPPPATAPAAAIRDSARFKPSAVLALVWFGGLCLFAVFTLRGFRRAARIRRRSVHPETTRHVALAEAAAVAVGLARRPEILVSEEVFAPAVLGFRSAAVVLPSWILEEIADDGLRDIFLHEFAHIQRGDQTTLCAQALARCLYWPLVTVHWLNWELGRSREEVCDNVVLEHHDAIGYGELLLRMAQNAIGGCAIAGTTGILNWEGELETRVVRLLDTRTNRATATSRWARVLLLSAFLAAGSLLCGSRIVTAQPRQPAGAVEPPAAVEAQPAPRRPTVDALGDPLPDSARIRLGTLRFHPPSGVSDLALSPDEKTIVSVGDQLIAWDAATGKERWRVNAGEFGCDFRGAAYGARNVAFASDSSEFFTPGRGNAANVWNTASGQHDILAINAPAPGGQAPPGVPRSIDVTPDGKKLAIGRAEGLVVCDREGNVLFEVANEARGPLRLDQKDRLTFFGHSSLGRFSPDGTVLAVVTSDRPQEIRLFDVETGHELRQIALAARLVRLAFSPDGRQIAATERDSAVRLYDVDSGKRAWSQVIELKNPFENYTSAVAFSPDGQTIAACATDHRIYLLDSKTGEQTGHLIGHTWYPWTLVFTSNSKTLYSSGWDSAVRRWDVAERKQLPLPLGTRASGVVAASSDGKWLAYADDGGVIRLVDPENGAEKRAIQIAGASYSHLRFSPDARRLAGGGSSGDQVHVAVWDVAGGDLLHRWDWPKGRDPHSIAESLCFTPDGTHLAANVFRQSAAYVWDLTSGRQTLKLAHQEVYGLSFSPDGKTLATAGWDSKIRFWDPETGEMRRDLALTQDPKGAGDLRMYAVCYAPEGGLLATAHLDGKVRIWQADNMQLRSEFQVEGRFIFGAISFSPDGLWLATGSANGQVALWDPLEGTTVGNEVRHQGYVYMVSFGRDSRTLVSGGSQEGVCYAWDLRSAGDRLQFNAERLWNTLAGDAGAAAYDAIWDLSDAPDQAVPLVAEKLRRVRSVVDSDCVTEGLEPQEELRLERLKRRRADGDPAVERAVTVRRAVSLLAYLGTADAKKLLEELAKRDPAGDLGRIATAGLMRFQATPR